MFYCLLLALYIQKFLNLLDQLLLAVGYCDKGTQLVSNVVVDRKQ